MKYINVHKKVMFPTPMLIVVGIGVEVRYQNNFCHKVSLDNFSIVGWEDQSMARTIREAMLIRVNDPSLNRNIGKYQLPHIWDEVLVKSPELQLKYKYNI